MKKHVYIVPTPETKCSVCGKIEELMPYGKNGAWVCFDCGIKFDAGWIGISTIQADALRWALKVVELSETPARELADKIKELEGK